MTNPITNETHPPMLQVSNLTKTFAGVTAVDDVSFDVLPGSIVGLIGPNGSGKSTTIDCLTGFARPDGGRVSFDGREVTGWRPEQLAAGGVVPPMGGLPLTSKALQVLSLVLLFALQVRFLLLFLHCTLGLLDERISFLLDKFW